jgi:hypothetical protein
MLSQGSLLSVTIPSPVSPADASVSCKAIKGKSGTVTVVREGDFEAETHFYPRVLNSTIHPLVSSFFSLGNERILARYLHLNPQVNEDTLKSMLGYSPRYFRWAGVFDALVN